MDRGIIGLNTFIRASLEETRVATELAINSQKHSQYISSDDTHANTKNIPAPVLSIDDIIKQIVPPLYVFLNKDKAPIYDTETIALKCEKGHFHKYYFVDMPITGCTTCCGGTPQQRQMHGILESIFAQIFIKTLRDDNKCYYKYVKPLITDISPKLATITPRFLMFEITPSLRCKAEHSIYKYEPVRVIGDTLVVPLKMSASEQMVKAAILGAFGTHTIRTKLDETIQQWAAAAAHIDTEARGPLPVMFGAYNVDALPNNADVFYDGELLIENCFGARFGGELP